MAEQPHDVVRRPCLTIDLEVDCPGGFDEALQRTVRENCNSLGFRNSEFEE